MNFWPRYIGDIQRKTGHLSCAEMGVYDRLLDHMYATESPLPGDLDAICRIARAMNARERAAVESVLRQFFARDDDSYTNSRVTQEIARAMPKLEAARANGKMGGRPRGTKEEPSGLPSGNPRRTHDEPRSKAHQNQTLPTEEVSEEANASSSSAAPTKRRVAKTPEIPPPFAAIVDAYHEVLPELPEVRLREGKTWEARKKAMRAFWGWVLTSVRSDGVRRATTGDEAMAWIRAYFERARNSDWIMGREARGSGHSTWEADLDYLLSEKGKIRVIEKTKDAA